MGFQSVAKTSIFIDDHQAEEKLKSLSAEVDRYAKKMNKARKANDKAGFDKAKNEYNAARKELNSYKKTVVDVTKVINNLSGTSYNTLIKTQRQLERQVRGMNKNTKEEVELYKLKVSQLKKVKAETTKVRNEMNASNRASQGWMNKMANSFNKYSMMAVGFIASITTIILSFRKAINVANDFNASVSNLSAMTGLVGKELEWLSQKAKDFSGSVTENGIRITQTAKEIVDGYILMGSARPELLKNKEALAQVTEQAIILATAQKMKLNDAVNAVAASMNQFNIKASKTVKIINALAAGSLKGSAFVQNLTDSLKNVGTVANGANMSLEQTIAMLEIMAKKQLKGEEAGTQLRSAILRLQAAGVGYQHGLFNITDALDEVNGKLKEATTAKEKDAIVQKIFGKRQITAGKIMLQNVNAYHKMTKAVTGTNTATEQAAKNTNNNKARLDAAMVSLNKVTIALGEKLAPALTFSTSTFAHLMRGTITAINVFNKYKKTIITGTGGIIAYSIATKIAANWDRIHYGYLVAKEAIIKIYGITIDILTGKTTIATIAQKAWNLAQKSNPIGLIVGLLVAAGTALYLYTKQMTATEKAQQELNKVNLKANKAIADEKVKLEILLKTAKNERLSKEKRIRAIQKINELSPKYLGNLTLETINTNAAKKATNEYIKALLTKAKVEATQEKLIELQKKLIDLQINPKEQFGFWQKVWTMTKNFGSVTKAAQEEVSNLNLKEAQLTETMKKLYDIVIGGSKTKEINTTKKFLESINSLNINSLRSRIIKEKGILKKATEEKNKTEFKATETRLKLLNIELKKKEKEKLKKDLAAAAAEKTLSGAIKKVTNEIKKLKEARDAMAPTDRDALEANEKQIRSYENVLQKLKDILNMKHELDGIKTKGIKDAILSDDDVQNINTNIETIQDSIDLFLYNVAHPKNFNGDSATTKGAFWEALGLGDEATTAEKFGAISNLTLQAFSNINQIITNSEQQQLEKFKRAQDSKRAKLDADLKAGRISYEQYTASISQLDTKLDKKKRKLEHDAAVRQKALNIASAISGTAMAIINALQTIPFVPLGLIMAAIAGTMGALQIGVIASTPVPQLATGNYLKVTGQDDGKTYNARLSRGDTGLYSKPTLIPNLGLVGETPQPELVFNATDTQHILNTPALIDAINATIGVRQFAEGNAREIIRENTTVTQTFTDPELLALMAEIRDYVSQEPKAYLIADEDYIKTHEQVKKDYDNFQKRIS